jgi:hypothetical protein
VSGEQVGSEPQTTWTWAISGLPADMIKSNNNASLEYFIAFSSLSNRL